MSLLVVKIYHKYIFDEVFPIDFISLSIHGGFECNLGSLSDNSLLHVHVIALKTFFLNVILYLITLAPN